MRSARFFSLISAFTLITVAFTECTREDAEKRKEELIEAMVNDINPDSLEADVLWLQNMGTRFALADKHRKIAVRIMNRFKGLGYEDVSLDSFLVTKTYRNISYEQWQYNVITLLEGKDGGDSLCIIGAHYDNILAGGDPFVTVPGANDNASGVAALIEIARVMKKNHFIPESTIMFSAFGAEEIGLWGSKHLASDPYTFPQKIRFMLNNDMIAYPAYIDPDDTQWGINIIDYENSHGLRADAENMCIKYTNLIYKNDNTYYKQSDSYSFYLYGYRALFFFPPIVDPNIHSLNDIAAYCDFDYCAEVVKISCALLADKN